MTNYNDGKIYGWNGGECPVHPLTEVNLFFKGVTTKYNKFVAGRVSWSHFGTNEDIVAFQVVKENKEPLVVWVNLYDNGFGYAYTSEEEANDSGVRTIDRRAVKFIEVQ